MKRNLRWVCKRLLNDGDIKNSMAAGVVYFDEGYRMNHIAGICDSSAVSFLLDLAFIGSYIINITL